MGHRMWVDKWLLYEHASAILCKILFLILRKCSKDITYVAKSSTCFVVYKNILKSSLQSVFELDLGTQGPHLYIPCVMIFWQATVDRQNRTSILVWLTLPWHRLLEIRSQAAQNSISQHRHCPVHRFYITSSNAQKYSQSQVMSLYIIIASQYCPSLETFLSHCNATITQFLIPCSWWL